MYASYPTIPRPTLMDQLGAAVMFVNACNQADVSAIADSWAKVEKDIVKHENISLNAPAIRKKRKGSSDGLDVYLNSRFRPAISFALTKKVSDLLKSSPVGIMKNLRGYDFKIVQHAIDLRLIWGEPAHTLLRAASLVYNNDPMVAMRKHEARVEAWFANYPRVFRTYDALFGDLVFECYVKRDEQTMDKLMRLLAERPKITYVLKTVKR